MKWIIDHGVDLFAIVGVLYTAARMIVALTPTPKDDAALEKVGVVLKTIAKTFGLTLAQGIRK